MPLMTVHVMCASDDTPVRPTRIVRFPAHTPPARPAPAPALPPLPGDPLVRLPLLHLPQLTACLHSTFTQPHASTHYAFPLLLEAPPPDAPIQVGRLAAPAMRAPLSLRARRTPPF